MSPAEVPLEDAQEQIAHHAHQSADRWVLGVALTAAVLAACAAVTALMAEHHANEAMIDQIQCSDQWNFYQAVRLKAGLLDTKIDLLTALEKKPDAKDHAKRDKYKKQQEAIRETATEKQRASEQHLREHAVLARGVTMFQVAIAVGAIAVLTNQRTFWFVSLAFGLVGAIFLVWGLLAV